jgi:thiamine-phosphate pyrophosphorylase
MRPPLPYPALVLVTDSVRLRGRTPASALEDVVREAVLGGVNVVQLREKHLPAEELVALGRRVRDAIAGRALFFVNGNLDAARMLSAGGVHLPAAGPSVAEARSRLGDGVLVSVAVHSLQDAVAAERAGADLLQLGTAFATASKPGVTPLGPDGIRRVCARTRIPVIAIGGIDAGNAARVMRAGAHGVAVVGAIMDAASPHTAAEALRHATVAVSGRAAS